MNIHLEKLSTTDPLTKLYNRRAVNEHLTLPYGMAFARLDACDADNDLEMIRWAGHGCAMGQATMKVRKAARHVQKRAPQVQENYRKFQCQKCDFSLWKVTSGREWSPDEVAELIEAREGSDFPLARASSGRTTFTFTPDPNQNFNREFTDYFVNGRKEDIGAFDQALHEFGPYEAGCQRRHVRSHRHARGRRNRSHRAV